jgi:diguanylate cyclase (GGDEF)-like protein/PAS domain S-box-containing protein
MANEKIFISASDNTVTRDIASKLKSLGYTVIGESADGDVSAHQIEELRPDLVLVDLHLKSPLNGIELAKKIHTDFDIPVIFVSSSADTHSLHSALPAQANALVNKPFEIHDLKSSIILSLYKHSMNRKLRESEERYALALQAANDGLWDWNIETNQIHYSPRWKEMLGLQENDISADPQEWFDLVHPDDKESFQKKLEAHLNGTAPHFELEYRIKHNNGEFLWVISRGTSVIDANGTPYRIVGSQSDITARKLVEERLAHDTLHDALTGLPNRILLLDRLQNRIERTKRNPDNLFAVMFIDLDRFKVVNDSLGHAAGDQLLVTVATRIKQCLRPEDTVARLSGDEFAILLDSITDVNDAGQVADRIRSKLITTTILGSIERSPTASIGIVIFDINYTTSEELLRDADSAMYHAKSKGGNQYQIFDKSMLTSAVELIQLEGELKRAVERKEWLCYYQPIFSLVSGKPVGAEALVRWQHPYRGILLPKEFINIAEETGAIIPIGEYILRDACKQAKIWRESQYPNFYVSVNLSARQFQDVGLVNKVKKILHKTGLPGEGLRLEITENIAIKNTEHTKKVLEELEKIGIHVSIDDFGTGYSSLSYLKNFPLNVLKIDQSFIKDLQVNEKNKSLVIAILSMARSMGLEVVAEGVENDEQLNFLRSQSCDNVQGFLLSHPLPVSDFTKIFSL